MFSQVIVIMLLIVSAYVLPGNSNNTFLSKKWSAPAVLDSTKKDKSQHPFNWSYNLNRDMFWSRSAPVTKDQDKEGSSKSKSQSVPVTPTVALPTRLYKERRGLGSIGKQSSGLHYHTPLLFSFLQFLHRKRTIETSSKKFFQRSSFVYILIKYLYNCLHLTLLNIDNNNDVAFVHI